MISGRAFDTRTERTQDVRLRRHMTATAAFGMFGFRPSATWARERYLQDAFTEPDSGFAYELVRVRLADRSGESVNASVELENRDTEEIRSGFQYWTETRRDRTVSARLAVRRGGKARGELQVTHREELDLLTDDTRNADLASLKGFLRSDRTGVRLGVDYEVSQMAARSMIRSVIFVGEGNGDYNEQGDLVGKGRGAYSVLFTPTTNTTPTNAVNLNLRFGWRNPRAARSRFGGGSAQAPAVGLWSWIKSNVALDQTITVSEESTFESSWRVYLMVPDALQRENTTVYGVTNIRQDWTFLEGYRNVSLTYRFQRRDEEDNRFEGIHENRFFGLHLVRLSRSLSSALTLTAEGSREIQRRGGTGIDVAGGAAYNIASHSALGGAGFMLPGGSSVDLDVKYTVRSDADVGAGQSLVTVRPKTTWRVSKMISVFASYDLTRVWDTSVGQTTPIVFAREGDSHRWNLTPTIRLAKHISLVASYNGRRETVFSGKRITDHELKMETRAFF
jgi:hypothetical protein